MQCGLATTGNHLIILYKARCTHISYTSNSTPWNLFQQNKSIPPNKISPHISIQVLFIIFKKPEAIISCKWKLKVVCPVWGQSEGEGGHRQWARSGKSPSCSVRSKKQDTKASLPYCMVLQKWQSYMGQSSSLVLWVQGRSVVTCKREAGNVFGVAILSVVWRLLLSFARAQWTVHIAES